MREHHCVIIKSMMSFPKIRIYKKCNEVYKQAVPSISKPATTATTNTQHFEQRKHSQYCGNDLILNSYSFLSL